MKMEMKVLILSLVMCIMFSGLFTYFVNGFQKKFYVLQVGVYTKEENRDEKLNDLKSLGLEGQFYCKGDKYIVYAYVSDDYEDMKLYLEKSNLKGVIKEYYYSYVDLEMFKKVLKEGDV